MSEIGEIIILRSCACGCGQNRPMFDTHGRSFAFINGHQNWQGTKASNQAIHAWVARHKTKIGVCSDCGNEHPRTEWSNVDHEYDRDLEDYIERCPSCHRIYDAALVAA